MERLSTSETPTCYVENGRAQEVLSGLPSGSVRLFNFSPPYLDNVDYERSAKAGDNRYGWDNPANDNRVPEDHPARSETRTNGEGDSAALKSIVNGDGLEESSDESSGAAGQDAAIDTKVSNYVKRHLRTCREIGRVGADTSVVCVEVDSIRENGAFRLVDLVGYWRRMLESVGYRIAEEITLGRKIAVSRRGAQLMREEDRFRRPGYFAPANVTSTLLVAFRGSVQERLRTDSTAKAEGFDKAWAKRHVKNLWTLQPPGEDRMDRNGHPCPQSLRVARATVRFYSTTGDMVCDPYAGVGTTGVAALEEGRHATLIEPVEEYYEEARKKTEAAAGEEPRQIGERGSVVVPGEQLRLPMLREEERTRIREAAYPEDGSPTQRHREMAQTIGDIIGRDVPPSLVSVFLRGERGYYDA